MCDVSWRVFGSRERVVTKDMRMHTEEVPEAAKPIENGESANPEVELKPESSIIQKYRGLKSKLKYLIYVS